MRLTQALKLKQDILGEFYKGVIGVSPKFRAQSEPPIERSERRIAVGIAKLDKGFGVEIRIQRKGGVAHEMADELKREHGDAVNVELLERLEIPPINSVLQRQPKPLRMQARRPLEIGTSVGHIDAGPGTLGAFVEYQGRDAVLSNAHVFAPPGSKILEEIFQPGSEGIALSENDRIGQLTDRIYFRKKGSNTVDAAICVLDDDVEYIGNVVPDWCEAACRGSKIKDVGSVFDKKKGSVLAKVGRTTGYTEGILTAMSVDDLTVLYHGTGNLRFDNAIEVTWKDLRHPFAQPGDSGSLIFDPDTMKAVGLHFAGGVIKRQGKKVGVSYACDLDAVLGSLKSKIILA